MIWNWKTWSSPSTPTPRTTAATSPSVRSGDIELYEYYDDNGKGSGDRITYYDLYKNKPYRGDLSDVDALYRDALLNENNLNHWAQLAYQTFRSNSNTYWDWAGGGFDKDFGSGVYTDLISDLTNRTGKKESSGHCHGEYRPHRSLEL